MSQSVLGTLPDGRAVHRLVVGTGPGPVLELVELGASVQRLDVTLPDGSVRNVVLGHPTLAERLASTTYLGASIGRYANRIAGARFDLDGRLVTLTPNDRGHNLHGGPDGLDRRLWSTLELSPTHAVLGIESPDGDQGFPGALSCQVRFEVGPDRVRIEYVATTDAVTCVNLTNHAYLNLDGEGAGDVLGHRLSVAADEFTPVDATGVPYDGHRPVAGTPFDLREPVLLAAVVTADHPQVLAASGLDHNFVGRGSGLRELAVLESSAGDVALRLSSDQPGLQVYTANSFTGTERATSGGLHPRWGGIALEPQHFPDSPNRPDWPSTVLHPGQTYRTLTEWRLTT